MKNMTVLKFWMAMTTLGLVLEAFALASANEPRGFIITANKFVHGGEAESVSFQGGVNNSEWLKVTRSNLKAIKPLGFDPCYTEISSDYRPVVTQPAKGKWRINFETVDLANEFPNP